MKRNAITLATLLLVFLVVGCGQSGPLYLPGNPSQIRTSPPEPEEGQQEENQDPGNDNG